MSATFAATYPLLDQEGAPRRLRAADPERFQYRSEGGAYLNLRGLPLESLPEIDEAKHRQTVPHRARLLFAAVDGGAIGPSGRVILEDGKGADAAPERRAGLRRAESQAPGRDRLVWSAGHCTPLFHACVAGLRGAAPKRRCALRRRSAHAVYPEQLARFRRWGGPSGHVETQYALADTSTGSSGHGFSAGLGFAVLHRSCGLPTRAFVIAGDAETEEGMTLRNAQRRLQPGRAQPHRPAGLQRFRHRRADHRSHAVALPEPLVCARLEHHRSGRPQHPRAGLRLPPGGAGLRHEAGPRW